MKLKKIITTSFVIGGILVPSFVSGQTVFANTSENSVEQAITIDSLQPGETLYLNKTIIDPVTRATHVLNSVGMSGDKKTLYATINGVQYSAKVNSDYVGYNYINKGGPVRVAQGWLIAKGYSIVPDGIFGEKTRQAIASFQQKNGLSIDSTIGPKTWNKFISK